MAAAGGRAAEPPGGMALTKFGRLGRFGRFRAFLGNKKQKIIFFWSIFSRFGMFFDVFERFWSVLNLGFGFGNNPRRQVFEETGI